MIATALLALLLVPLNSIASEMSQSTFFGRLDKSFADVPINADQTIPTTPFLEAAESLCTLFGL
jgi:hypothetical protein